MYTISRLLLAIALAVGLSSGTFVIRSGAEFTLDRTEIMFVATLRNTHSGSTLPYLAPCGATKGGTLLHIETAESRVVFRYDGKGATPAGTFTLDSGFRDLDGNPIHTKLELPQCPPGGLVFREVRDARIITGFHVFSSRPDGTIRPSLRRRLGL